MHLKRTLSVAFHRMKCLHCCSQSFDHWHPSQHGCDHNQGTHHDVQPLVVQDATSLVDEVTAVNREDPSKHRCPAGLKTCACDEAMSIEVHVVRED